MRHELIGRLSSTLGAVTSRRVGVALGLWGEAGVGKTWTAQQVLRQVPCPTLSLHATTPTPALLRALGRPKRLPAWTQTQLERLLAGEHLEHKTLLDTLTTVLAGLGPFVLHLEDLHECPAERTELIVQLAAAVGRTPGVGLLVTSRQELGAPWRTHHLGRLSAQETQHVLEATLGAALPSPALAWLEERTRGNPLFALEFEKYLVRQGLLWSDGQRWHWRAPPEGFMPATIEALIDQLTRDPTFQPATRRTLEARALLPLPALPSPARDALWARVADVDDLALAREARTLERAGLLRAGEFTHPLFPEVVRAALGARWHEYARRSLAALAPDWPELAAPFLGANGTLPAVAQDVLERAAAQAQARGDHGTWATLLAQTVRWCAPHERAERALQAARALRAASLGGALELAELAASHGEGAAVFLCAELLVEQGRFEDAERRLTGPTAEPPDPTALARQRWELALLVASTRGTFGEVVRLWCEHPEWHGAVSAHTLRRVGGAQAFTGQLEQAERLAGALLARDDLTPDARFEARNLLGQVLQARGDWTRLLEVERETIALARLPPLSRHLPSALLNHASSLSRCPPAETGGAPFADEHWRRVEALIEEADQQFVRLGLTLPHGICLLRRAGVLLERGHFQDAETRLLEAHALIERHDHPLWRTEAHLKSARLYLDWQPPYGPSLALRHAHAALEGARACGNRRFTERALILCARAEALGGTPHRALHFAEEALGWVAEGGDAERGAETQFAHALALAASGRRDEACDALLSAAARQRALGHHTAAERSELELDRLRGDLVQARTRWAWLRGAGHLALAHLAARYFPTVDVTGEPIPDERGARLGVLGPVQLERHGQRVPYRGQKRGELLARLLEARLAGQPECRTLDLLDALYPDAPEREARRTLRQQVYLIRGDLGAGSVLSTAGGYALGAVGSDAEDFLASGDATLWRGAYLEGLGEGWVAGVRDALAGGLRKALERSHDWKPATVRVLARSACQMDPYDAEVLRVCVQALLHVAGPSTAHALYLERRRVLLEVGEELPESLPDFLRAGPPEKRGRVAHG